MEIRPPRQSFAFLRALPKKLCVTPTNLTKTSPTALCVSRKLKLDSNSLSLNMFGFFKRDFSQINELGYQMLATLAISGSLTCAALLMASSPKRDELAFKM